MQEPWCVPTQLYNQNKCVILFMEKGNSTKVAPDQEANTVTTATMLWQSATCLLFPELVAASPFLPGLSAQIQNVAYWL